MQAGAQGGVGGAVAFVRRVRACMLPVSPCDQAAGVDPFPCLEPPMPHTYAHQPRPTQRLPSNALPALSRPPSPAPGRTLPSLLTHIPSPCAALTLPHLQELYDGPQVARLRPPLVQLDVGAVAHQQLALRAGEVKGRS